MSNTTSKAWCEEVARKIKSGELPENALLLIAQCCLDVVEGYNRSLNDDEISSIDRLGYKTDEEFQNA